MAVISLEEALFNPWVTILWLSIFWLISYLIFRFLKVSNRFLKKVEIVYLLLGFIGIVGVVLENRKMRLLWKQEYLVSDIQHMTKQMQFHYNYFCFEYTKGPGSPIDFDEREIDQKLLCEWGQRTPDFDGFIL